jgi:hypothetical protein
MKALDPAITGKITIAAGITAVLAAVVVLTGFSSGNWLLGGLGDLMDVVNSALVVPLFVFLGALLRPYHAGMGRAVQIMGITGALVRLVGAFLIFAGMMAFDNSILLVNAGMGLMGMALMIFLLTGRGQLEVGRGYMVFSLAVGLSMAINILGVFLYDAYAPLLQGEASFADMNPLLVALLVFAPIQILGYPIWLLWTGRLLQRAPGGLTAMTSQP